MRNSTVESLGASLPLGGILRETGVEEVHRDGALEPGNPALVGLRENGVLPEPGGSAGFRCLREPFRARRSGTQDLVVLLVKAWSP